MGPDVKLNGDAGTSYILRNNLSLLRDFLKDTDDENGKKNLCLPILIKNILQVHKRKVTYLLFTVSLALTEYDEPK